MVNTDSSPLCEFCEPFDLRALLLAAKAQGPPDSGTPTQVYAYENIHASLPRFLKHRPNLLSLKGGAETCRLCAAIWNQFSHGRHPLELTNAGLSDGWGADEIYLGTELWVDELTGLPIVAAFRCARKTNQARQIASFEAFADRDHLPSENVDLLGRSTLPSSCDDACIAVASDWLSECIHRHRQCKIYNNPNPTLPRRVAQVFTQADDRLMARVIDTGERCGRYTALSYCWGGPGVIMYTEESKQRLHDGIPLSDFPPTLRDAMIVTHKLGISYIWIDCLCIQQDDKLDWGREAVRMQSVYRYAAFTLRAACAERVTDTLFPERPVAPAHCALPWRGPVGTPDHTVYLRSSLELSRVHTRDAMISRRGWTLEEDLLAPRTLTFDADQIWFDCAQGRVDEAGRRTRATEDYNDKNHMQMMYHESLFFRRAATLARKLRLPPVVRLHYPQWEYLRNGRNLGMNDLSLMGYKAFYLQGLFKTPGGGNLTYFDVWRAVVAQFTCRILTQPKDVLTALAGIAEAFHQTHGDEYIAGMWRYDLIRSMSWARKAEHKRSKDGILIDLPVAPPKYLAPSWSWASITGKKVSFVASADSSGLGRFTAAARVVNVHVELAKSGLFGPVSGGSLILRAPCVEIPTPLGEVQDGQIQGVREKIRKVMTNVADAGHEFSQQHRAHSDQRFALVHLCDYIDEDELYATKTVLLLESCEDGSWRRIGCFCFMKDGRHPLLIPPDPVALQLFNELRTARWMRRTIKMV